MGTCNSAPSRYPDPIRTDKSILTADELMTRGIAFAQLASVERSVDKRLEYLNFSRDFLRGALQRLSPNDRFDFAAAHIASVLVKLGDDPHDLKGYLESVFSAARLENRRRTSSSDVGDEAALRVMESLAFASPPLPHSQASPRGAELPLVVLSPSPQSLPMQEVSSLERLQSSKVSVRLYNSISGEEDYRFELPLRSFGTSVDSFYQKLSRYIAYFSAYDLEHLEFLKVIPGGKVKRRPGFDRQAFNEWLEDAKDASLAPLLFCPLPLSPAESLPAYEPAVRILTLNPAIVAMNPLDPDRWDSQPADLEISCTINCELAHHKSLSLSLTDQRDTGRTFRFTTGPALTAKIPCALLRPRSEDDAGIFDVHVVIDGRWRTSNRKVLSIITSLDQQSDDELIH